jgi:hypothetical protein
VTDKPNKKSAAQPPVSAHPAFPVIVAVWFAALLAIGSAVLPLSMFENLALSSGLADSFAAAQPPLGTGTRIAVAVVGAALGALLGIFVARKVAAATVPGTVTPEVTAARFSPKRPLSAHDELGEDGIDALDEELAAPRETLSARRRAFVPEEASPDSEFAELAPFPAEISEPANEPLDLVQFEQPEEIARYEDEPQEDFASEPEIAGAWSLQTEQRVFLDEPETRVVKREIAAPVAARPLGELGMVELVERFAIALQRHRDRETATAAPSVTPAAGISSPEPQPRSAREDWEDFSQRPLPAALRPLDFDEPVADEEHSEPLPDHDVAATLSHDRIEGEDEWGGEADDAAHDAAFEEELDEPAEAAYTSLLSMKSPIAQPREPMQIDRLDGDDPAETGPVVVFPGQAGRRSAIGDDSMPDEVPGGSMRGFDAPLARIDQAAARASFAPHPARGPGEPANAERALREALEKLQKMSGAA